tara:strand:- start:4 stop:258 length:255 start_codon:yes stop_codon:yes gene_type:complete
MKNFIRLKKKIIFRSKHRGTKEMDLLLGSFVSKYIDIFNELELKELDYLLSKDDDILYNCYFKKDENISIPKNIVTKKFKDFKL